MTKEELFDGLRAGRTVEWLEPSKSYSPTGTRFRVTCADGDLTKQTFSRSRPGCDVEVCDCDHPEGCIDLEHLAADAEDMATAHFVEAAS